MSLVVFSEFDEVENFFPELYVAIDAEGDNEVSFGGENDVIHDIFVHVTNFVVVCSREGGEKEVMEIKFPEFAGVGSDVVFVQGLLFFHFIREVL